MTDDIIEVQETVQNGKSYVIAYSLKEQKRSNDLKELFIISIWAIFLTTGIMLITLYTKLDGMNVLSRFLG